MEDPLQTHSQEDAVDQGRRSVATSTIKLHAISHKPLAMQLQFSSIQLRKTRYDKVDYVPPLEGGGMSESFAIAQ
jgi:hypothetical protein